jgi:hypothetical protein
MEGSSTALLNKCYHDVERCLLGCDAVLVLLELMFRRKISAPPPTYRVERISESGTLAVTSTAHPTRTSG